ncbi:MAG: orotidine 5-phosphate decarboxylase [Pseudomonadota bacterium]
MMNPSVQLSDVVYNAATQSFEARAIVHFETGVRIYPCAIDAPITMSFEDAAAGLSRQALRRHQSGRGLRACIPAQPARRKPRIDPFQMLRRRAA